jgi:hypothetical protein
MTAETDLDTARGPDHDTPTAPPNPPERETGA